MIKTKLNNYELAVLYRGAEEERNNGVEIHSYPKFETQELLDEYFEWAMEGKKVDYEIVIDALKDLFQWWATYFACGEETARAIQKEYDDEIIRELTEKCERRYQEELEGFLNDQPIQE